MASLQLQCCKFARLVTGRSTDCSQHVKQSIEITFTIYTLYLSLSCDGNTHTSQTVSPSEKKVHKNPTKMNFEKAIIIRARGSCLCKFKLHLSSSFVYKLGEIDSIMN